MTANTAIRQSDKDRRRTIRIRRSHLLTLGLESEIDRPAIKVAETDKEYKGSFRLLYQTYREMGYTGEHESKMLYNMWSLLHSTGIFVFKSYEDVIASVSLIQDTSKFGLPIDAVFREEVDLLRGQGRRVAEIGALATSYEQRMANIVMLLFKAIYHYTRLVEISDLVAIVNPKHVQFYTDILLFEPFSSEMRHYEKVGAPAVALRVNLETYDKKLEKTYGGHAGQNPELDLHAFFTRTSGDDEVFETDLHTFFMNFADSGLKSAGHKMQGYRRILSSEELDTFLEQRPEIKESLTPEQKKCMYKGRG